MALNLRSLDTAERTAVGYEKVFLGPEIKNFRVGLEVLREIRVRVTEMAPGSDHAADIQVNGWRDRVDEDGFNEFKAFLASDRTLEEGEAKSWKAKNPRGIRFVFGK